VREIRTLGSVRAKAEWLRYSTIAKKSTPGTNWAAATGSKVVAIKIGLGWIRLRRHLHTKIASKCEC
jgi:hypothetical protein